MNELKYYIPGAALILLAFIIPAVPEILIAVMAAMILFAGVVVCYVGHLIRKTEMSYRENAKVWFGNDGFTRQCFRRPVYGRDHRPF